MKVFIVLTVAAAVIIGSYLYMKSQDELKAQTAAQQTAQKTAQQGADGTQAGQPMSMSQGGTLSQQGSPHAQQGDHSQSEGVDASWIKNGMDLKRVQVEFAGKGRMMNRNTRMQEYAGENYDGSVGEDDGFEFSGAKYNHPDLNRPEVIGNPGAISDDLLIVESRLEERAARQ